MGPRPVAIWEPLRVPRPEGKNGAHGLLPRKACGTMEESLSAQTERRNLLRPVRGLLTVRLHQPVSVTSFADYRRAAEPTSDSVAFHLLSPRPSFFPAGHCVQRSGRVVPRLRASDAACRPRAASLPAA